MKSSLLFCTALCTLLLSACKEQEKKYKVPEDNKEVIPYDIAGFIRKQVVQVDSTLYAIYLFNNNDKPGEGKLLDRPAFKKIVEDEFLTPDFNSPAFKGKFSETNFFDATIDEVSLIYTARSKKEEIQKATVYLDQNRDNAVKRIYLEKQGNSGDTLITTRLIWKNNKSFQVVKMKEWPGQEKPQTLSYRVAWNDREEEEEGERHSKPGK